jgi:hypothetical protein
VGLVKFTFWPPGRVVSEVEIVGLSDGQSRPDFPLRLFDLTIPVERLRATTPVVVPSGSQFRNPEHRELFLSGLCLAAGETA